MQVPSLKAEPRSAIGTKHMRRARAEGKVPAVLYGKGKENLNLSVPRRDLEQLVKAAFHVLELDIGGKKEHALIRGLQRDNLRDDLLHIDLLRVDIKDKVRLVVPFTFLGTPKGASNGGLLEIMQSGVDINCPAINVPKYITVEVAKLELGDGVRFKEVPLPEGADLLSPPEGFVVKCAIARRAIADEQAAAAAAAPGAAAPGAAAPGAAPGAAAPATAAAPAAKGAPAKK